jgi:asparagine synthase (glutamine-hydrolysing)
VASIFPQKRGFNFLVRRGKTLEERYIGNANMFTKRERAAILRGGSNAPAPSELCKKFYEEAKDYDDITKMQYLDINMWLMGDILLKADKTSMANSLELRVPFLDKEVMNLAEKIPTRHRVSTKNTKLALRAAADKTIPSNTASRQKLGFPVPIRVWLKEEKYFGKVLSMFESDIAKEFFHTKKLVKMLQDHKSGKADLSRRIWTIYTFLVWYEEFFIKR